MSANAMGKIPARLRDLYETARSSRENSYSPYSGHKVGAAIRLQSGEIFGGCNVENSSYGGTNCAERVAIQKAVSERGEIRLAEVLVITDSEIPWPPCGLCRQVVAEFAEDIEIHATNLEGDIKTTRFSELFPDTFNRSYLKPKGP